MTEQEWGGPAQMSAWEALMWRAEVDPRTRSTGILLEVLASVPAWEDVIAAMQRLVQQVPRLRDRVITPPITALLPVWSPAPGFDLDEHLRHIELEKGSGLRELLDLCEQLMAETFDPQRPPWEVVLVSGLEDGTAGFLLRCHHSMSDGQGLIQLLEILHDDRGSSAGPPVLETSERPVPPPVVIARQVGSELLALPSRAARTCTSLMRGAVDVVARPRETVQSAASFGSSLGRMLSPPSVRRSPLLAGDGSGASFLLLDADLETLKASGRSAGASVNDAFVSAVLGGVRHYHAAHAVRRDHIPVAMPVSLRKANDPAGGNRFAGIRIAGPVSTLDPAARMREVGEQVSAMRHEPAIGFLDYLAPVLTKLPDAAIVELSASLTASVDVQISNIRGMADQVFLAGAEVRGLYPLGPRPGVAAMITMITYAGRCCIGVNLNPHVITDREVFASALSAGFDEVLDLALVGSGADGGAR